MTLLFFISCCIAMSYVDVAMVLDVQVLQLQLQGSRNRKGLRSVVLHYCVAVWFSFSWTSGDKGFSNKDWEDK